MVTLLHSEMVTVLSRSRIQEMLQKQDCLHKLRAWIMVTLSGHTQSCSAYDVNENGERSAGSCVHREREPFANPAHVEAYSYQKVRVGLISLLISFFPQKKKN